MTATHTRTHVYVAFANPYVACVQCSGWVTGWHDDDRCCCDGGWWNEPCGHRAVTYSACPSWGPVDGCSCQQHLGRVDHDEPPAVKESIESCTEWGVRWKGGHVQACPGESDARGLAATPTTPRSSPTGSARSA